MKIIGFSTSGIRVAIEEAKGCALLNRHILWVDETFFLAPCWSIIYKMRWILVTGRIMDF